MFDSIKADGAHLQCIFDGQMQDLDLKTLQQAQDLHNGKVTFFGGGRSKELYRLPDRFTGLGKFPAPTRSR